MRAVIADMPRHWLEERKNSKAAQWDEMWDGVLHMPPMPTGDHQDLELDLGSYLKREWARPIGGLVRHQVNLTTTDDEHDWRRNYRIPDLVLLTPDRRHIDRNSYMAGAPAAVVEIESPDDETRDKFEFYGELGVPEVWVIHRDTKVPTVFALAGGQYQPVAAGADGWVRSGLGIELRQAAPGRLGVRLAADPATAAELPEG
jgi:Uma2 family endonuclease